MMSTADGVGSEDPLISKFVEDYLCLDSIAGQDINNVIKLATEQAIYRIENLQFGKNDRKFIMVCLESPVVAKNLCSWRDPESGNNILHHFCAVNDEGLVSHLLRCCGRSLLSALNDQKEPPSLLIHGTYNVRRGLLILKLFKQHEADLHPLKNAIINDIVKPSQSQPKYTTRFLVEALKMFLESNMITEADVAKFDEAANYVLETFSLAFNNYEKREVYFSRRIVACYCTVISKQEYKYDPLFWTSLQANRNPIIVSGLPKFVWCLLDRRLSEKEALVELQYFSKLLKKPKFDDGCIRNLTSNLLLPLIVKFPRLALAEFKNIPPKCFYMLIERYKILSYPLSEDVASYLLTYADFSVKAPFRSRWNRLSLVTPIFSIEELPDELIAIIISYTTPRITKMFSILNKNMNRMYKLTIQVIWRLKYEREMPYIIEPDLSGKSFCKELEKRKYKKVKVESLGYDHANFTSCEAYKQYFIYTYDGGYCVKNRETKTFNKTRINNHYFYARIFDDTVYVRTVKECQLTSLVGSKSSRSFVLPAKTYKNLAFAVDENIIACQNGFFDVVSGLPLSMYEPSDEFKSCMLKDRLCYEETTTSIKMLDPRVEKHHVASRTFNATLYNTVKFNVIGHSLIVASDKIDIFDVRDLTRPVLSSPYLDSGVKFIDPIGMRAFTKTLTWNLSDMTYIYQKVPYLFADAKMVVTNGAEVFSYFPNVYPAALGIERAWHGSYSQYGDFVSIPFT